MASSFDNNKQDATCTASGSDILSYFRDRDLLVRTLGFPREHESAAHDQFHGMLCALPTISDDDAFSLSETFASIAPWRNVREDSGDAASKLNYSIS